MSRLSDPSDAGISQLQYPQKLVGTLSCGGEIPSLNCTSMTDVPCSHRRSVLFLGGGASRLTACQSVRWPFDTVELSTTTRFVPIVHGIVPVTFGKWTAAGARRGEEAFRGVGEVQRLTGRGPAQEHDKLIPA